MSNIPVKAESNIFVASREPLRRLYPYDNAPSDGSGTSHHAVQIHPVDGLKPQLMRSCIHFATLVAK
jgi:hypothetical protein